MTHACVGLASPHSRPNTRSSASASPRIAEEDPATRSPVPSREARPPPPTRPRSGAQRNGGRSRCARGAARRKRSVSRILPLPASGRHCGLMHHVTGKKRVCSAEETLGGGGGGRSGAAAGTARGTTTCSPRAQRSPFPPGLWRGVKAALLPRGWGGKGGKEAASPPLLPPLPQPSLASPAPSTRQAVTSIL